MRHRSDKQLWVLFKFDLKNTGKTSNDMRARMQELGFMKYIELIYRAGAAAAFAEVAQKDSEQFVKRCIE